MNILRSFPQWIAAGYLLRWDRQAREFEWFPSEPLLREILESVEVEPIRVIQKDAIDEWLESLLEENDE